MCCITCASVCVSASMTDSRVQPNIVKERWNNHRQITNNTIQTHRKRLYLPLIVMFRLVIVLVSIRMGCTWECIAISR